MRNSHALYKDTNSFSCTYPVKIIFLNIDLSLVWSRKAFSPGLIFPTIRRAVSLKPLLIILLNAWSILITFFLSSIPPTYITNLLGILNLTFNSLNHGLLERGLKHSLKP